MLDLKKIQEKEQSETLEKIELKETENKALREEKKLLDIRIQTLTELN